MLEILLSHSLGVNSKPNSNARERERERVKLDRKNPLFHLHAFHNPELRVVKGIVWSFAGCSSGIRIGCFIACRIWSPFTHC